MTEVEDMVKRYQQMEGVEGLIIYNCEGIVIRSTLPSPLANQYSYLIQQLQRKSTQVFRDISSDDAVQLIRIRSNKHEIMVVPETVYTMVVIQRPAIDNGPPPFMQKMKDSIKS